jgi:hypothetical protein
MKSETVEALYYGWRILRLGVDIAETTSRISRSELLLDCSHGSSLGDTA